MSCEGKIQELERKLGRKLTSKEKEEIKELYHKEEEIKVSKCKHHMIWCNYYDIEICGLLQKKKKLLFKCSGNNTKCGEYKR